MKRLTPKQRWQIYRDWMAGVGIRTQAELYGVTQRAIEDCIRELGFKKRRNGK